MHADDFLYGLFPWSPLPCQSLQVPVTFLPHNPKLLTIRKPILAQRFGNMEDMLILQVWGNINWRPLHFSTSCPTCVEFLRFIKFNIGIRKMCFKIHFSFEKWLHWNSDFRTSRFDFVDFKIWVFGFPEIRLCRNGVADPLVLKVHCTRKPFNTRHNFYDFERLFTRFRWGHSPTYIPEISKHAQCSYSGP